jgi:methionine synthase II (cobalamin-independent)
MTVPPQFRAEQIGSLLRPQDLLSARTAEQLFFYSSNLSKDVKGKTEDAISAVVKKQQEAGIAPLTDGEFRRFAYCDGFFERLGGFKSYEDLPVPEAFRTNYPPSVMLLQFGVKTRAAAVAEGKVEYKDSVYLEEWEYLRSLLPKSKWKNCKITMPSVSHQHNGLRPGRAYSKEAYSSDKDYFADLAAAYRQEIKVLYEAGLRNIQFDDPQLTFFVVESFREGIVADGGDPDELLDLYIWATNEVLRGKPEDLHVGVHLCRGNFPGSVHVAEGSYEWLAQRLFSKMNYDSFCLEFDGPRSGDFSPLRHLPVGKKVVLGLVSTKSPDLEDVEVMEKKVYEAADVIAQGQGRTREDVLADTLSVSTQCGFSSVSVGGGVGMTEDRMWEKLSLVKQIASRVWD